MLDHSCQVQRHPLSERGHDCYQTPEVGTEAVFRHEDIDDFWECAAGPGAIVRVGRRLGRTVIASDIVPYEGLHFARDFLGEIGMPAGVDTILTNPPFKLAEQFVEHALWLAPKVIMLLRLAFLESERRCHILEGRGLARVHVFRKRLPMMHREGWQGPKANSGMAFAWFVWIRGHTGPTIINRISWER